MRTSFAVITVGACSLLLSACDKLTTNPPAPTIKPAQSETSAAAQAVTDTAVPSAGSVLSPATATRVEATPARSNSTMSATPDRTSDSHASARCQGGSAKVLTSNADDGVMARITGFIHLDKTGADKLAFESNDGVRLQ